MISATAALLLAFAWQAEAEPPMPPDMQAAFTGWTRCLSLELDQADRAVPVRRVADAALGACRPLQDAMLSAHGRWLDGSSLSAREKAEARRSMARSVRDLHANVARMVRMMRED